MDARATTLDAFIRNAEGATGATRLYVMAHDVGHLAPVTGGDVIDDPAVLESMLAGRPHPTGGGTLIPLPDRAFPIAAALLDDGSSIVRHADVVGQLISHQLPLFEQMERSRRRDNMGPAAQLQWDQLPVRAAVLGDYEIGATLEPAFTVAGDLYDIAVAPSGNPTVLSMDAMGHGVTATLSACLTLAAVRSARREGASLAEQVSAGDRAVLSEYDGDRFVTMAAVEFGDQSIQAVNAGHEPLRRGTASGSIAQLEVPADPPLGLEGATDYRVHDLEPLAADEIFCLLSDGAAGSRNSDGDVFGDSAIGEALADVAHDSALVTAIRLARRVIEYTGGELQDDLTSVVVRRRPDPGGTRR